MSELDFVPVEPTSRLRLVNPRGRVGVVTLWSRPDAVLELLGELGVDLSPESSTVAVLGTLYGDGLGLLLRDLLYNPQIEQLLILGRDLSDSRRALLNLFELGVEGSAELGEGLVRVRGTQRLLEDALRPELFQPPPRLVWAGEPNQEGTRERARRFFRELPAARPVKTERLELPKATLELDSAPCNPRAQQVIAQRPLQAWLGVLGRLLRFGRWAQLEKGRRRELQDLKVVVEQPRFERSEELQRFGFEADALRAYQRRFLDPASPGADGSYTYGSRLGEHFGASLVDRAIALLRADPESRQAYLSLWDSRADGQGRSSPCLASVFFRRYEGRLTLMATFRTHNAVSAWLPNLYGLLALRDEVASATGLAAGAISLHSHSISISEADLPRARWAQGRARGGQRFEEDPNGSFRLHLEGDEIVATHLLQGQILKIYRGRRAATLGLRISRDEAVSSPSHALWLGQRLQQAEDALRRGEALPEDA